MLTVVATFILILLGGLVTSTDSGLAVPDWPTTFGYNMFLYPLSKTVSGFLFSLPLNLQADLDKGIFSAGLRKALERNEISVSENIRITTSQPNVKWQIEDAENQRTYTALKSGNRLDIYVPGVLYEHSHRLIGSVVGILTVLLTLFIWLKDSRKWMKWLGIVAVLSVIAQGVMGGLRVVHLSLLLAIIHGCLAQLFFALTGSFVLFTSRGWNEASQKTQPAETALRLRRLGVLTTSLIYIQLIFGAVLRHTGARLDAHLLFAALVTIHIFLLAKRILRYHLEHKRLVHTVSMLAGLLALQLMLGIGAFLGKFTVVGQEIATVAITIATLHVMVGALMLLISVLLTLRIYRYTGTPESAVNQRLISGEASA